MFGGSGGFGLFLGRNGQKLPKKGQKMLKSAIFNHFYYERDARVTIIGDKGNDYLNFLASCGREFQHPGAQLQLNLQLIFIITF